MDFLTKILKLYAVLFLLIASSADILSQSYNSTSSKAIKYFDKARQDLLNENYDDAMYNVNKALKIDAGFVDAYLLKAELCVELNDDSQALKSYENVFEIDSMAFPGSAVSLSKLYMKYYEYDKSIVLLNWYLSKDNRNKALRAVAEQQMVLAKFRKSLYENPVEYDPKNIGDVVNTSSDEYVNQYYVNEDKLIYTKRYKTETKSYLEENVFVTTSYDSIWSYPCLLFEEYEDVGAACVSSDGNEIYFSASNWSDGFGSCDVYCVIFKDGKWSRPENIKAINTSEWESQPCISYDGKELYFVRRNRRLATSDIYVSMRDHDGTWMKPSKLNHNINTDGNEMAPFIYYDGKTLYFSSDTHPGMGGYDLFVSTRVSDNEWSEPRNMGFPLNSCGDEINIVIANDAQNAYISAVRDEGYGAYDIYEFEIDEAFRPDAVEIDVAIDEDFYASVLDKQKSVVLKNIYFEFDSAELTKDSGDGIDMLFNLMSSNEDMRILLEGHTDDMGDAEYNVELSKKRAEAVKSALVNKGVAEVRIETHGCGAVSPIVPNDGDENRKLNRRVEMRLIK